MGGGYVVYGAAGSGSVAVEAALTLIGAPYEVVERQTWADEAAAEAMARVNPMRQVPALALPSGELMTESAAILTWLADSHPAAGLAPGVDSPLRPRFLRWMSYVSAQIYSLYWVRDDITRLAADQAHEAVLRERTAARIEHCWRMMEAQAEPAGRFLLGEEISALDLYVTVVSRWGPRRKGFYVAAPRLGEVVRRVDAEPRLGDLWAQRFPFTEGWEG
ncbi:glutathione S-transferase family protein [Phenylobacterium hankyongense]|uniref:Glutathione S-transferase family protein n=1 Tax=Phenylobacterium hankyongense TaxID=1813876 RepID=A0A328AY70_9CAUL|nr:glutathione S-transferase family protein [Phenylobacterium hankyongense]RAK59873.1 glutathione S-transferase family protein [Phenylobacterium hankyongense]